MDIPIPLAIGIGLIFLFIQFSIIEAAVKRGIDASDTHERIEEWKESQEKDGNKED